MTRLENILAKVLTVLPALGAAATLNMSSANAQADFDVVETKASIIYRPDHAARMGVLGVNVVGNSLLCGIIAAANGRDVLKEAGQCFGGATLQYLGMEMGAHDVPVLPGFGLRTVETGTSIIENTLAGREPFEQLQYELGPMLYQFNLKNGDVDMYWRATPIAGFIYFTTQGYDFNWADSFSHQTFTFHSTDIQDNDGKDEDTSVGGMTIGNVMVYKSQKPAMGAHEFTHVLQYTRFRPAQLLIQEMDLMPLNFIENTLRYRMAEDLVSGIFWGAGAIGCASIEDNYECTKRWWNLLEAEAYIMQTATEE